MIYRPPKVVCLAVDLHKNLVQMPLPIRIGTHLAGPLSADLGGEHRAKSIPPKSNRFVANLDAALMQQVLGIAK